jgi:predicted porin
MKQTTIVAALALLAAGAASAQSSVTIYGRVNASAEQQENIGATGKQKVLQNSASRIGFKGTEDLGGGLKAGFQLEHGFNIDTGAATGGAAGFWGRQSEVNLSGGFGMIRMGRFTSEAYFATADYISMHNHDTGTSEDKLYAYIGRNSNKIAYRTPEFVKGLTLEGAVSAGEGAPNKRNYDFAANWALGSLQLGAGYEKADSAIAGASAKQAGVRALYEVGPLVFGAYVQRDTNGYGANLGRRTTVRGSVAYNFGANELHFNYGKAGDYSNTPGIDTKASQLTVAYNYNLSKRTKVYAFYSTVDNNQLNYFGVGTRPSVGANFRDPKAFALGIRHNF